MFSDAQLHPRVSLVQTGECRAVSIKTIGLQCHRMSAAIKMYQLKDVSYL
jgi:hypothetical protein